MSGRPLSGPANDGGHAWSASAIANSIVHTIARSYMWLPLLKGGEAEQHGGEPEYTSEHLEEALIALRTSESSPDAAEHDSHEGITPADAPEEVVLRTENLEFPNAMKDNETMMAKRNSNDIEMSTDITYNPANPKQNDQNSEIKPNVETVSTQSTADRVRLNTQTTTDDLPVPEIPPQTLAESEANRHLKKSKVPVLKTDHSCGPPACINVNQSQGKPNQQKFAHSKIPQRLAPTQTNSGEHLPLIANAGCSSGRPQTLRGRNVRLSSGSEKQLIENALLDTAMHSKLKEGEDKENQGNQEVMQHLMMYKMAKEIDLQTDETAHEHEKHLEIEEICKNLIDNIQIVENVLDSLPTDGAANLRAFCEAYNFAPAQDACTMSNDLQKDSHCQSETKDDDESRKLYEEQVYKNNLMVSALEYDNDHIDSTTGDIDQMPKPIPETPANVATIDEENDDDYEDYDDEQDKMAADAVLPNSKHGPRKLYNRMKNMSRESKTCLMGSASNLAVSANKSVLNMPMPTMPTSCVKDVKEESKKESGAAAKQEVKAAAPSSKPPEKKAKPTLETHASGSNKQAENGVRRQSAAAAKEAQALDAVAFEANIFNIIQSQKINNILRLAMPYNNLLLPVFVSSPSSIMHTLEQELRHTLETKKQTALYFSAANAVIEQKLSKQSGITSKAKSSAGNKMASRHTKEADQKSTCARRQSYWLNGSIIGPQIIAQDQATWAKPPFYYGPYRTIQ